MVEERRLLFMRICDEVGSRYPIFDLDNMATYIYLNYHTDP